MSLLGLLADSKPPPRGPKPDALQTEVSQTVCGWRSLFVIIGTECSLSNVSDALAGKLKGHRNVYVSHKN